MLLPGKTLSEIWQTSDKHATRRRPSKQLLQSLYKQSVTAALLTSTSLETQQSVRVSDIELAEQYTEVQFIRHTFTKL